MWSWKDSETLELFNLVENFKKKGKSLKEAFFAFAMQSGRKENSVRNYYYKTLKSLSFNKKNSLKINLKYHKVNRAKSFTKEEEREVFSQIGKLMSEGVSLRSACLKVANGDVKKMLRYQNKFRNIEKEENRTYTILYIKSILLYINTRIIYMCYFQFFGFHILICRKIILIHESFCQSISCRKGDVYEFGCKTERVLERECAFCGFIQYSSF